MNCAHCCAAAAAAEDPQDCSGTSSAALTMNVLPQGSPEDQLAEQVSLLPLAEGPVSLCKHKVAR